MSKEMLLGKSNANLAEGVGSTTVVIEEKKKKRGGGLPLILIAVGLAAVALTSITVLAPASFYGYVESPGGINDSGNGNRGDVAAAAFPTRLASSVTAIDGKGNVIEHMGVTESGTMTITGYSDGKYDRELQCSIDSLPLYCGDDSITVSDIPPGEHTIAIADPTSGETIVREFRWEIS